MTEEEIQAALAQNPKDGAMMLNYANFYLLRNDTNAAINQCYEAQYHDPEFSVATDAPNIMLARTYMKLGDLEYALEFLENAQTKTLKKSKDLIKELLDIEKLIQKQLDNGSEYHAVVAKIDVLLKHKSMDTRYICIKIDCLLRANDYAAALSYTNEVVVEFPDEKWIQFWRGRVLIYKGEDADGQKFLQKALEIDPNFSECKAFM